MPNTSTQQQQTTLHCPAIALCSECIQRLVDDRIRQNMQSAISPTSELTEAKRSTKQDRKESAATALLHFHSTLGLQCALIRRLMRGGAHDAAAIQAKALLESFVRLSYSSIKGVQKFSHPIDRMIAAMRVAEVLNCDEAALMLFAVTKGAVDNQPQATAGNILSALETIALGPIPSGAFARKSRRRQQVREADRAERNYKAQSFADGHRLITTTSEDAAGEVVQ